MTDPAALHYRSLLATAVDPPEPDAAAVRLGDALRRLIAAATGTTAGEDLLGEAAAVVDALAERLEPYTESSRYPQAERLGGPKGMFLTHPIIGPTNPIAPRMRVHPDGEAIVGEVTYGPAYEGPPNGVHGGQIAAGFDAILTMAAGTNGRGGVTKGFTVRFRKPTPLNTPLVYRGEIESREERVTKVRGVLLHGDVVCAEGHGEIDYRARPSVPGLRGPDGPVSS